MINNENEFSLNQNEIGFIDEIGGPEALFSYLNMKKTNIQSIYNLISILFPKTKFRQDIDGKIKGLFSLTNNVNKCYETVYITKSNGKKREINKPNPDLKYYQKAINKNILAHIPVSDYAAAYKKGSSIARSAAVHVGKPQVLKLDIKNFFGSILYKTVQETFIRLGYDYFTATTLATLCCCKGRLPQGTPTSPAISNIVMRELDDLISCFCNERNIAYTRYSDDMIFSGDFDKDEIIFFVEAKINEFGFKLNHKKTKLIKQGQRQTVTGVVVNEKQQLPKSYRRKIRQEIYYCQKHSVKSHILRSDIAEYIRPDGDVYYKEYLLNLYGRINYALQINPADDKMLKYRSIVKSAIDKLDIVQRKINDEIFNSAKAFYENESRNAENIFFYLKNAGYTEEEIAYSGFHRAYRQKYHPVYNDEKNIIGFLDAFGNKIINKNYDTFFGLNLDKSLKYIILSLDKQFVFKAAELGIKNAVSFLADPNFFVLTKSKLEFIREYGNTVVLHGAENKRFKAIRQILIGNNVNVL